MKIDVLGPEEKVEYQAALELKKVLARDHPNHPGEVLIFSNFTCYGQNVKDIDILLFAHFQRTALEFHFPENSADPKSPQERILFRDVCFCIELKDKSGDEVMFQGNRAVVRYDRHWMDATAKSEEQKISVRNFLKKEIGWSPWICNAIWFRNIGKDDLPKLQHNFLPASPTTRWLFYLARHQKKLPSLEDGTLWFQACKKDQDFRSGFERAYKVFATAREACGAVTRSRLEKVTKKLLDKQDYAEAIGERMVVIRGRAGTGKTIKLLRIAHDLCVSRGKRCLILSYNRALVSDIRRLIALAGIDNDIAGPAIEVQTVHYFVRSLCLGLELTQSMATEDSQNFESEYKQNKKEMLELVREKALTSKDIQALMTSRSDEVAWDAILIDEGQDWPDDEREIFVTLFGPERLIVADGQDQMIRTQSHTDWARGLSSDRYHKAQPERRSLRQKSNLCRFISLFSARVGLEWDLAPQDELQGGKIIVLSKDYNREIHEKLFSKCREDGNNAYELLFMVPPGLVKSDQFILREEWEQWGMRIWDGTNFAVRGTYPSKADEFRVVQYDSCRGLEGWIAVCVWLDELIPYKEQDFVDQSKGQLDLSDPQDRKRKFAFVWCRMPMTRPIDTLVITLKNPQSELGKILHSLAKDCSDFVQWI